MVKVYIAGKIPAQADQLLQATDLTIESYNGKGLIDANTLKKNVSDADYLITPLSTTVDRDILDHAPKLKLIANFGAGTNNVDTDYARQLGIPVTNTPKVSTVSTAESTTGLIIALFHRIAEGDHLMRTTGFNGWAPLFFLGHELSGKTLGIIGMGQIGQAVAKRMHAFDMPILYTQRHRLPVSLETELGAKYVSQAELLEKSDVVSIHIPLNADTKHLLGIKEFAQMKSTAFLINAARGPIIDEVALANALSNHVIAGAALDVYEHEPEVADQLKVMKNVVLTPHLGNATVEARNAMATIVAKNVIAASKGETVKYVVNGVSPIK
ncbi:2-hydroxyacid dehydrogenase family protein [Companilactobacillus kimchiensis]|uniref:Phosphoglycerate dehydrogenase n=1 Tax=Companilactobacillus kimchiensis TaxID=993692 RepID=A0A0R2LFJ3_9LACO|nr:2-hydroxyacid dehydrogenase family protein [Companilactobacillus kimchiensis]KRO00580.1 phosphoglycerate dehydrogenase [Companilactobacillus kimchiensis]